jgi:hypothetical protein
MNTALISELLHKLVRVFKAFESVLGDIVVTTLHPMHSAASPLMLYPTAAADRVA